MIRGKIEIEVLKSDSGKIRIICGGCNSLVPDTAFGLMANLEVELLMSLGILDKMNFKVGDRVVTEDKISGIITKSSPNEIDVEVKMDDDGKCCLINRKYLNYEN
ncbi:hypothetical protein [Epilithonimonas hispanica]|uniref:Uncharacterized protein n=1 Tax=Epilithonimonas hispanica TaxID=358687 RepID=A0A3D9D044_9FLAO|nr:hypothetical protein [Epilithonimonas hispanica]REC71355.1 hypothetical protein DRF58_05940 [Epilithonimonas hispanica]